MAKQKKQEYSAPAGDLAESQDEVQANPIKSIGLLQVLGKASAAAQRGGRHADHSAIENLLQTMHTLKIKAAAASGHLDDDSADALASLQALL